MIVYTKRRVRIGEVWFDSEPDGRSVDILRYFERSSRLPDTTCSEFYTILVDLRQDQDLLLRKMKKDTRYEIRRAAQTDNFQSDFYWPPPQGTLASFSAAYDDFAAHKGLQSANLLRLTSSAAAGNLALSRICDPQGSSLVWHAYYCEARRARLLYSATEFRLGGSTHRAMLGRANRLHHYSDMLHFKDAGVFTYDFGGWYEGTTDQARLGVNRFKEEFGGEITLTFNCARAVTALGRLALWARAFAS